MPSLRPPWVGLRRTTGSGTPMLRRWRTGTILAAVAAGALFATSAINSHGVDLRASSVTDLNTLLTQERQHVDAMQHEVSDLNGQVTRLTREVKDTRIGRIQQQLDALRGPAGFSAVRGPGVTVTLDDAPKRELNEAMADGSDTADALLVHQQDIQAVVNALWSGGADAVTVQGQRIVSTSGIKCVGNTVVLHGVPYSPPYRIAAIGNTTKLMHAIETSSYVQAYQTFVSEFHLGWDLEVNDDIMMPAYSGTTSLRYAKRLS